MSQITNFSEIDQSSAEGRCLIAAIDVLSHQESIHHQGAVHIGQNMSNDDLLGIIGKRAAALFPEPIEPAVEEEPLTEAQTGGPNDGTLDEVTSGSKGQEGSVGEITGTSEENPAPENAPQTQTEANIEGQALEGGVPQSEGEESSNG